jgi:hypothetical protein
MTLTVEALNILFLLLPGLLAGQIYYACFKLGEISVSRRVLDSILFTFVVYLVVSIFVDWEPLAQVTSSEGGLSFEFSASNSVIWLSLISIVLVPVIVGFVYFNDHIHSTLRKLRITTKTSRDNTWNEVFSAQNRHVILTLKDGRRVRGFPTMFSTSPEEGFLYLFNPAWVDDGNDAEDALGYIESNCHGFLLNRENIDLIEFTLDSGETLDDSLREK